MPTTHNISSQGVYLHIFRKKYFSGKVFKLMEKGKYE